MSQTVEPCVKRSYLSRMLAENAAILYGWRDPDYLLRPSGAYRCPFCTDWHLTSHPGSKSRIVGYREHDGDDEQPPQAVTGDRPNGHDDEQDK